MIEIFSLVNLFGWLGSIFVVLSLYLTGQKNKIGWVISIIASCCFVADFILHDNMYHLIPINVILIVIALKNYREWKEYEETKEYLR